MAITTTQRIATLPCAQSRAWNTPHVPRYASQGPSATWYADDTLVLAWGMYRYWEGVGLAWMIVYDRPALEQAGFRLLRPMRQQYNAWWDAEPWRWLETSADMADDKACRFVEWLGFEPQIIKYGYGEHRENICVYARKRSGV